MIFSITYTNIIAAYTINASTINSNDIGIVYDVETKRLIISGDSIISSVNIAEYASEVEELIFEEGIIGLTDNSFKELPNLRKVKFPSTLYNYGDSVFSDCKNLAIVDFPEYVDNGDKEFKIGRYAFQNCSSIDSIHIPSTNSCVNIYEYAFQKCTSMKSVGFGSTYVHFPYDSNIQANSFGWCTSLTKIYIQDFGKWISKFADDCGHTALLIYVDSIFVDGEYTNNFVVPEGVKEIRDAAFVFYSRPYNITLSSTVESIGSFAFASYWLNNGDGVRNIDIPSSLKQINLKAFYGNQLLERVNISDLSSWLNLQIEIEENDYSHPFDAPNSQLYMNDAPLSGIIEIPENVQEINKYAFKGCNQISELIIPSTVNNINDYAFIDCSGNLTIQQQRFNCYSLKNSQFTKISFSPKTELINYEYAAFKGLTTLKEIILPDKLTYIAEDAFNGCINLKTITIPLNVKIIKDNAFKNCSSIKMINLTDSLESIGDYAFDGCTSLDSIELSDNNQIKSIGKMAFRNTAFLNRQPQGEVYLKNWLIGYKGDMPYSYTLKVKEGTIGIAGAALQFSNNLVCLDASNDIKYINSASFYGCSNLEKNHNIDQLEQIDENAFAYCSSLLHVKLPITLRLLNYGAFSNCNNLRTFELSSDSIELKFNIFTNCSNLESVYVLSKTVPLCENDIRPFYGISSSAILYVPVGCKDKYPENITIDFADVVEIDVTSMKKIIDNTNTSPKELTYYDLFGRRVEDPQSGLYIKNGKKVYIK